MGISKILVNIAHFFKIDEAGRIKKLYDFLVRDEEDPNQGISYKTLLSIVICLIFSSITIPERTLKQF